jgi:hypothetical protein
VLRVLRRLLLLFWGFREVVRFGSNMNWPFMELVATRPTACFAFLH